MSSFLDMLTESHSVDLKKCGDVVVSPSDNMVAIYCHFCRDIFTHLPEFLRHIQWAHNDVLHFTKEQNVYSMEELMSGEEGENAQSPKHNNSSGDFATQGVAEEPKSMKNISNHLQKEKTKPTIKKILAELDLKDENSQIKNPINIQSKPVTQKIKAARNKAENGGKSLRVCDLKSHTIARNARKRMTNVKHRILQVLRNDGQTNLQLNPGKTTGSTSIIEPLDVKNIPEFDFKTPPKPLPKSSHLSVRKSTLTMARVSVVSTSSSVKEAVHTQTKPIILKPKPTSTVQKLEVFSASSMVQETCHFSKSSSQNNTKIQKGVSPLKIREIQILPPLSIAPKNENNLTNPSQLKENQTPESLSKPLETKKIAITKPLKKNINRQVENQTKNKVLNNVKPFSKDNSKKFFKNRSKLESDNIPKLT
ncbi:protein teflon [Drosophila ficusphila]|uniref:protein teflon n=1 Tax=Drosophila ficusphila TaxID=30025 RepID=UPI0007E64C3D|nr:protein teflon [Drosophila ficusphila]